MIAADGHQPFQFIAVFQKIIDRLIGALARDNGDFGVGGFLDLDQGWLVPRDPWLWGKIPLGFQFAVARDLCATCV